MCIYKQPDDAGQIPIAITRDLSVDFLSSNNLLNTTSAKNGNENILTIIEHGSDLLGHLLVITLGVLGEIQIVLGLTRFEKEGDLAVISDVQELKLDSGNVRDLKIVRGGAAVLILLTREDVDTSDVGLGVTVLSSLGGGNINNLAWLVLNHNEPALSDRTSLHRVGVRRTGIGTLESRLLVVTGHRKYWDYKE
jgi:hypothetical protein